jgi:RNA processing factor Prp31
MMLIASVTCGNNANLTVSRVVCFISQVSSECEIREKGVVCLTIHIKDVMPNMLGWP